MYFVRRAFFLVEKYKTIKKIEKINLNNKFFERRKLS